MNTAYTPVSFIGVVCFFLASAYFIGCSQANTDKKPQKTSNVESTIAVLTSMTFPDVREFCKKQRLEIINMTDSDQRMQRAVQYCKDVLGIPIDRSTTKRHIYTSEVFLHAAESCFMAFWEVSYDKEKPLDFLLDAMKICMDDARAAEARLTKVHPNAERRLIKLAEARASSDLEKIASSLRGRCEDLIGKYIELTALPDAYKEMDETARKRIINKVHSIIGRYPKWYEDAKESS